jgi:hypothetical protein
MPCSRVQVEQSGPDEDERELSGPTLMVIGRTLQAQTVQ